MFDASAFALPASAAEAFGRHRQNYSYFKSNYSLLLLAAFCLALISHPGSLFVFIFFVAAWIFLFYGRDQQLLLFNRPVNDGVVLVALIVATIYAFSFTDIGLIIGGAYPVSVLLLVLHAVSRETDDLYIDESEAVNGGLVAAVPNQIDVRVM